MSSTARLAVLLLTGCAVAHIEPYTPKKRSYDAFSASAAGPEDAAGSLWRPDARNASLFSDYRAFREHDLVVVRVEENANARRTADTNIKRDSDVSASISAFLRSAGVSAPQLDLTAGLKNALAFDGSGQTARSEKLTATVPAIVKKVLPNGNLFIEGHRVVLVNNEEQHFYISGVVRPIDITQDNSVLSSYVADAEIEFTGRGVLTNAQKPGVLTSFWNWIWPF